ncbi:hypothetical protein CVV65_05945 [Kyrpidia spormannii]|uniref:HTH-like domain-containing protein n=1 Tax=Kyrpidia spormannii TaxID=2055160 RepID=A0A2K8N7I2_9BACL|nr:hypothetical protein CVV65_05945 [Kyrpidia spormannii]
MCTSSTTAGKQIHHRVNRRKRPSRKSTTTGTTSKREEVRLKHRIDEIYTDHPAYGSRRMTAVLRREGGCQS